MRIRTHVKVITGPLPLAPLIDVVFLLLVFFMISSSLVFWPGTRVDTEVRLPPSRMSSMTAADKLVITVNRSDQIFFNDSRLADLHALEKRLSDIVRISRISQTQREGDSANGEDQGRSPVVALRCDETIPYRRVVEIMSLARSLGMGVYLVTDSPARDKRGNLSVLGEGSD